MKKLSGDTKGRYVGLVKSDNIIKTVLKVLLN